MASNPSDIREEVEKLERKHAENPEGRYFVPLANAYRKAGELDRAIEVLRGGIERHTDYLSAHIVLGRCLADKGEGTGAEAEFRYVLTLDPQNLIALRTLGELALAGTRVEDARGWYLELLKVDPMNEDARRALDAMQVIPERPAEESAPEAVETPAVPGWEEPAWEEPAEPARGPSRAPDFDVLYGGAVELREDEDEGAPFEVEGQAVVTETIAELYTRQGFYSRAADVYRELIRRRGPSQELEERLRRVEELAGRQGAAVVDAPREPEPPAPAEPEPVETDWLAGAADEVVTYTPSGSDDLPTLREDEPGAGWLDLTEPAAPPLEAAAADAFAESFVAGFTPLDDLESGDFGVPQTEPEEYTPIRLDAVADPFGEASGTGKGETIREHLAAVFSWRPGLSAESPAPAEEETQAPAPPAAPESEPLPEITAFAPALEPQPSEPFIGSSAEPFPWELPGEPLESSAVAPEEPAAAAEPEPPVAPPTDDEDLESFQAWLRSLKR